jgi:hypothetical protein
MLGAAPDEYHYLNVGAGDVTPLLSWPLNLTLWTLK